MLFAPLLSSLALLLSQKPVPRFWGALRSFAQTVPTSSSSSSPDLARFLSRWAASSVLSSGDGCHSRHQKNHPGWRGSHLGCHPRHHFFWPLLPVNTQSVKIGKNYINCVSVKFTQYWWNCQNSHNFCQQTFTNKNWHKKSFFCKPATPQSGSWPNFDILVAKFRIAVF